MPSQRVEQTNGNQRESCKADVFQGLGRLKDSYSIQIDDYIRPVVHAPMFVRNWNSLLTKESSRL